MIVPMKHLTLLCVAEEKDAALQALSRLNAVQVETQVTDSSAIRNAGLSCSAAEQALRVLDVAEAGTPMAFKPDAGSPLAQMNTVELIQTAKQHRVPTRSTVANIQAVNEAAQILTRLNDELNRIRQEILRYTPFGDFSPERIRQLAKDGVEVKLLREPLANEDGLLTLETPYKQIQEQTDGQHRFAVVVGAISELPKGVEEMHLPQHSQKELFRLEDAVNTEIANLTQSLTGAAEHLRPRFQKELELRADSREFIKVAENMQTSGAVAYITGFFPARDEAEIVKEAEKQSWGIVVRDPLPDETPPVLLEPPRLFRPVVALFRGLGIMPAYNEGDMSLPFYIFFTIFFAMLVGDAGYGVIILVLGLLARRKWRKAPSAPFTLITVFSIATIIWGVLTGTYFGIDMQFMPNFLNFPTVAWLNDTNNIMQLCFLLGAIHLSVARIWNAILLAPNLKMFSEIGWLGIIWSMYCVTCSIVIEGFVMPGFTWWLLGGSVVLILLFMHGKGERMAGIIDYFMLPMNVISGMSDIISYVRLYAVSMAAVQLASNFNAMAVGLDLPIALKIPAMLVILLVGHVINLGMGALGVLVHAVRLNTLEFSTAKGVTWSGTAFTPFNSTLHSTEESVQ